MARYRLVGALERVFTDLLHGEHVTAVKRKDAPKDAPAPADGSSLVLAAGDEVTLAAPVAHPHLEPMDAEAKAHAKKVADAEAAEQQTTDAAPADADAEPPAADSPAPADAEAPAAAAPQE